MSALGLIRSKGVSAQVKRVMETRDSGGGLIRTPQNHILDVKVFVQDKSGDEAIKFGRKSNERFAMIYVEPGFDIKEKDILIVGTRTFDMQTIRTRGSMQPLQHMVIEAVEKN